MDIKTAYSTKSNIDDAAKDINEQLGFFDTELLLYFASSKFNHADISLKMQETFPVSSVFGCSTAGELISGKMLDNSIVAMAFNYQSINDVKIEVIQNVKNESDIKKAFDSFENYYKIPVAQM